MKDVVTTESLVMFKKHLDKYTDKKPLSVIKFQ